MCPQFSFMGTLIPVMKKSQHDLTISQSLSFHIIALGISFQPMNLGTAEATAQEHSDHGTVLTPTHPRGSVIPGLPRNCNPP